MYTIKHYKKETLLIIGEFIAKRSNIDLPKPDDVIEENGIYILELNLNDINHLPVGLKRIINES